MFEMTPRAGRRVMAMALAGAALALGCAAEGPAFGRHDDGLRGAVPPPPEPPPFQCAGFTSAACPGAGDPEPQYLCADDWRDECDPEGGGSDCPGLCVGEAVQLCGGPADLPCGAGEVCVARPGLLCVPPADGPPACSRGICVLADDCGPPPPCPAPPPECHYEGDGCAEGQWSCGTLVCDETSPL